ncbi:RcnB family protein [[Pseudomonas] boreopolis]|uniref:RcnB family protein n=1 Tax=Xanthomonas boreopolis TaxID=86183 RepID=UPI003D3FEE15
MKPIRLIALALTSVLALGAVAPAAMADGRGHGWDRGWDRGDRDYGRHDRHDRRDRYDRYERYQGRRDAYYRGYYDGRRDDRYYRPAPVYRAGPPYGWAVGRRYYDSYRGPIYVVDDYPRYYLRRPPRGYHWVRDDTGNFLMVAIATGIIADLVLNH